MIVPFSAGGGTDISARLIGQKLGETEVGGAVRDQRVAGGVGLVERVVGGRPFSFQRSVATFGAVPDSASPHEFVLHRRHQLALLLADRLAQVVRLGAG